MNIKKGGALLIASALIWGAVIIGSAMVLKGSPYKENVNRILVVGVIVHIQIFNIIFFWAMTGRKGKSRPGLIIILSAVIWGAVLVATSIVLKGTEFREDINRIVQSGAGAHLLFIWAPIGIIHGKERKEGTAAMEPAGRLEG